MLTVHKQIVRALNKFKLLEHFNVAVNYQHAGKDITLPIIQNVGIEIMWLNFADSWLIHLFSKIPGINQKTILDIGVNLGQTLLGIKAVLGEGINYIGFEPNPVCIYYVEKLISFNNFRNCDIIPAALSGTNDALSFIVSTDTDDAGSIVQELRPDKFIKKEQHVCTLKFDDIQLSGNLTDTIIKIDVEGAELEVLTGMKNFIKTNRPPIICEVLHAHSAGQLEFCEERNKKIGELLTLLNYNIFRIIKNDNEPKVIGFKMIVAFDKVIYNSDSGKLCDYLFLPETMPLPIV